MSKIGRAWLRAGQTVGIVSLLALSGCASTPAKGVATPPQSYDFDCDVLPGHLSEWKGSLRSNVTQISGSIELVHRESDPRWEPVANVFLKGESANQAVGLQLTVYRDNPAVVEIAVRDAQGKRTVIGSTSAESGPISFLLALNKPAELTIAAGGASGNVELGSLQPTRLALSCSTGEFKYKSVVVTP